MHHWELPEHDLSFHDYITEYDSTRSRRRERKVSRWAAADLSDLNLQLDQWHRIADREMRADTPWHNLHEFTNEHRDLTLSKATLLLFDQDATRRRPDAKPH